MQLFGGLYRRMMRWSRLPRAPWYLAGLSFAESSFFPIPPDVMLAPMALARPARAWRLALLATVASALGGLLGYAIGHFAFDMAAPLLQRAGCWPAYLQAVAWFDRWGVWVVFIAGFSPVPYKIFDISAGAVSMALVPFLLASIVGRGARFFLVAGLIVLGGESMERRLRAHIDHVGWFLLFPLVGLYLVLR